MVKIMEVENTDTEKYFKHEEYSSNENFKRTATHKTITKNK